RVHHRPHRNRIFEQLNSADQLLDFHLNGGDGDPENDMVMNRNNMVRTVSVSQIIAGDGSKSIQHRDLIKQKVYDFKL
ncbi:MAG: hypothetical protein AAGC47_11290, partial [Bacteroidota bacterium]